MLDMGFFDDVTKILDRIKNRTNLGLFSATISQEVMTVSWMYQRDEVEITVAPTEESKPDIDQYPSRSHGWRRRRPCCVSCAPARLSA